MKKLLVLIVLFAVLPLVAAQSQLVYKQNTQVDLKIPVFFNGTVASPSATCNITIFEPDGDVLVDNQLMTNQNAYHNYTLTPSQTLNIGDHESSVFCNDVSNNGFSTFTFAISPSGTDDNNIGQIILLTFGFLFSVGFIWFGINKQDPIFALFGGLALVSLGLYTLLNGVASYRNVLTEGLSLVVLGVAAYVSIRTSMEMIDG